MRWLFPLLVLWLFKRKLSLLAVALLGCGATKPPCTPEALAAIETAYIAEAVAACRGETYESCKVLPAIRAKFRAKREAWVECAP